MKKHNISIVFLIALSAAPCASYALPDRTFYNNRSLIISAHQGHLAEVKKLLETGANVNSQDTDGLTPLISAVLENKIDVIKELIKREANVNLVGFEQCSALCFAAEQVDQTIFNILIDAGADVNGGLGMRPLHRAVYVGNAQSVERLLNLGADATIQALCKSDVLETPLELAIRLNEADAIIALIAHITDEDIAPLYATLQVMQQQGILNKSPGKDLTKTIIIPELINDIIAKKVARIKTHLSDADETILKQKIKTKVYKKLNSQSAPNKSHNAYVYTNEHTWDEALGSFNVVKD